MAIDYATGRVTTKKPDLDLLDETQRAAVEGIMEDELKNIVIQANAGSGKALSNDSLIVTSVGYKKIKDVESDCTSGCGSNPHKHSHCGAIPPVGTINR